MVLDTTVYLRYYLTLIMIKHSSSCGEEPATMGRDEEGERGGRPVLRARQDRHAVHQRLPARPHHLPLQARAAPAHWHAIQVCGIL